MNYKNDILFDPIWDEIKPLVCEIYNNNFQYLSWEYDEIIKKIIINNSKHKIICTHDNFIFLLVKWFAIKNGNLNLLHLPEYLSNIRIESWTDGYRVYYDNLLLSEQF